MRALELSAVSLRLSPHSPLHGRRPLSSMRPAPGPPGSEPPTEVDPGFAAFHQARAAVRNAGDLERGPCPPAMDRARRRGGGRTDAQSVPHGARGSRSGRCVSVDGGRTRPPRGRPARSRSLPSRGLAASSTKPVLCYCSIRPSTHDRRIGVVLGRAVAHEIGHFLLQTNTHASDGLMRARILASEFADLSRETFRLDKAAEAHLAASPRHAPARDALLYESNR